MKSRKSTGLNRSRLPLREDGVSLMEEILTGFLISVVASVVGYYICKWLDRDE